MNVLDPEVIEDATLTKYSENKYVICEGATYEYSFNGKISGALNEIKTYGEEALSAHTYNLYLDQYGNLIGNEEAPALTTM